VANVKFSQANDKDLDDIYEQLKIFKREFLKINFEKIDEERLFNNISKIQQKNSLICARTDDDKLIGSLGFVFVKQFWTEEISIMVLWCYVLKEYRQFNTFKNLINMLKKLAKGKEIVFGSMTKIHLDNVMEKLGFEELGKNWRFK